MANYYLIVKTADAEMKALENTDPSVMERITPIIELTRGRKLPSKEKDPEKKKLEIPRHPYDKRLERICGIFKGKRVIFDLTSDSTLSSIEIKELYNPDGGYKNWVMLLSKLKDCGGFADITPCVILKAEDELLDENMAIEVDALTKLFNSVAYRSDIFDDNCYYDIEIIKRHMNGKQLVVIVDCSYVVQASISDYAKKVKARVTNLRKIVPNDTIIIVSATSFPRNIGDIGDDFHDSFQLSEVELSRKLEADGIKVAYSDYGSINPIRNDTIIMSHGWIPRIDVAIEDSIFYYRERRPDKTTDYAPQYTKVAQYVVNDKDFPKGLDWNWGIKQIRNCAAGSRPGSSPSFWIAVRMNIHLAQQVKRLVAQSKKKN
jgi:hypothetical protein